MRGRGLSTAGPVQCHLVNTEEVGSGVGEAGEEILYRNNCLCGFPSQPGLI